MSRFICNKLVFNLLVKIKKLKIIGTGVKRVTINLFAFTVTIYTDLNFIAKIPNDQTS